VASSKKLAVLIGIVLAAVGIEAGMIYALRSRDDAKTDAKTANSVLEYGALGHVRVGMTTTEVEHALGSKLNPFDKNGNEECWYTRRSDGTEPYVGYMMSSEKIVRIDIRAADSEKKMAPPVTDSKGFGIGASEKSVVDAYGPVLQVSPHKYGDADDHYLRITSPDGKSALLFETWDGKVTTFRTGIPPYVDYVEGCS